MSVAMDVVDPRSADAIDALESYFAELDARFPEGFDLRGTLAVDAPQFEEPEGVFVLGRSDGSVVACGGVQNLDGGIGEIKRMWVSPAWRGLGLGKLMLAELESHVGRLGNDTVRLDTHSALTEAIAMYESAGYRSIERYNANPFAKRWFEKPLGPTATGTPPDRRSE